MLGSGKNPFEESHNREAEKRKKKEIVKIEPILINLEDSESTKDEEAKLHIEEKIDRFHKKESQDVIDHMHMKK